MNQNNPYLLYYVHDPMCSWCWAFVPAWQKIKQTIESKLPVRYLLGGLAPDSSEIMPQAMQEAISSYWRNIEVRVPGTKFNHEFWTTCQPRRSTYPSCRAVIAARTQQPESETAMIRAIQEAYYLQAKNPSDDDTLIAIAGDLGLDQVQFAVDLNSAETQSILDQEMDLGAEMGAQGFPSLILQHPTGYRYIPLDYNRPQVVLDQLKQLNAI